MVGLLLTHVPPVLGDNVVVEPTQILSGPLTETIGFGLTVIGVVGSELHAVVLDVNINVALPSVMAVTTPVLLIVATDGLLLDHVPPVIGFSWVVSPTHNTVGPEILTIGFAFTVIVTSGTAVHPWAFVTVTLYTLEGKVGYTVTLLDVAFAALLDHW